MARATPMRARRALRDACSANARRALEMGAHESARRWCELALATASDGAEDGAREGATRERWMLDARDLEVKGDALGGGGTRGGRRRRIGARGRWRDADAGRRDGRGGRMSSSTRVG